MTRAKRNPGVPKWRHARRLQRLSQEESGCRFSCSTSPQCFHLGQTKAALRETERADWLQRQGGSSCICQVLPVCLTKCLFLFHRACWQQEVSAWEDQGLLEQQQQQHNNNSVLVRNVAAAPEVTADQRALPVVLLLCISAAAIAPPVLAKGCCSVAAL